jgi:hypothetical protein
VKILLLLLRSCLGRSGDSTKGSSQKVTESCLHVERNEIGPRFATHSHTSSVSSQKSECILCSFATRSAINDGRLIVTPPVPVGQP